MNPRVPDRDRFAPAGFERRQERSNQPEHGASLSSCALDTRVTVVRHQIVTAGPASRASGPPQRSLRLRGREPNTYERYRSRETTRGMDMNGK